MNMPAEINRDFLRARYEQERKNRRLDHIVGLKLTRKVHVTGAEEASPGHGWCLTKTCGDVRAHLSIRIPVIIARPFAYAAALLRWRWM